MICSKCKRNLPNTSFMLKTSSKGRNGRKDHEYRVDICRKCLRAQKRAEGLCICGRPLTKNKSGCDACLKTRRESVKRKNIKDRADAISYYGGKCAICGEDLFIFLTIDHINNNGAEHRKKVGHKLATWLRQNNYPEGFQVLCMNCNHAKWRVGGEEELRKTINQHRASKQNTN
jgi:hypothetical protein